MDEIPSWVNDQAQKIALKYAPSHANNYYPDHRWIAIRESIRRVVAKALGLPEPEILMSIGCSTGAVIATDISMQNGDTIRGLSMPRAKVDYLGQQSRGDAGWRAEFGEAWDARERGAEPFNAGAWKEMLRHLDQIKGAEYVEPVNATEIT